LSVKKNLKITCARWCWCSHLASCIKISCLDVLS